MQVFYLYTTLVILGPVFVQAAQKRFKIEVFDLTCHNFTNNVKRLDCGFTKTANGKFLFNSHFMYDRKFGKDWDMQVRLRVTPNNGKLSYNLLDFRTTVCSVTSQTLDNILLRKFFGEWLEASNFPLNCLFKANIIYKVEKFSVTHEFLPAYLPLLNGTFSLEFLNNVKILSYTAKFGLIPKNI